MVCFSKVLRNAKLLNRKSMMHDYRCTFKSLLFGLFIIHFSILDAFAKISSIIPSHWAEQQTELMSNNWILVRKLQLSFSILTNSHRVSLPYIDVQLDCCSLQVDVRVFCDS